MTKLKHLIYWLFKARGSGLLRKLDKDSRDFEMGGLFGYNPRHQKKIIKTYSIKNQRNLNTCVFNSAVLQKEIDEKCILSVRSLVSYAKKVGLLSGNGWSTLRNGQKALQNYGVLEEKDCKDIMHGNWTAYTNIALHEEKASKHKTESYWILKSRNAILEQLDNGKIVACAMGWFSGFNQGGGFRFPWIISKIIGWLVGGHAVAMKGYIFNYKGQDVYVFQNSYGLWGDGGDFYISMDYFDENCLKKYGAYVNKDISVDIAKWLIANQGKVVKKKDSPKIYLIQGDKKLWYPDAPTMFVHGRTFSDVEVIDDEILDEVKKGKCIRFKDGGNVKEYLNAIKYNDQLKELFKKYI